MSADGMTCRSRHIPVVKVHVGLGGTERREGGNHSSDGHQGL